MKVPKKIYMRIIAIFMLISIGVTQIGDIINQTLYAAEKTMSFSYTGGSEKVFINEAYGDYNTIYRQAKLDDYVAYCLDYGRKLPSGNLTYKRTLSDKATSVLIAGYPNRSASEMGASNAKEAYLGTQLALWKTVNSTGDSKTGLNFDISDLKAVSGQETLFTKVKKVASNVENNAKINPYNPKFSLTINSSKAKNVNEGSNILAGPYVLNMTGFDGKTAKVELSGAPSGTKIVDKNGAVKSKFTNGENIYVQIPGSSLSSSLTLKAEVSGYEYTGVVYGGSSSEQSYATVVKKTVALDKSIKINWENTPGKIQITKVDNSGSKISGVKFELRNSSNKRLAEATTDGNGKITFNELMPGTYKVVETYAPSGYILNSTPVTFEVTNGETLSKTIVNQKEGQKSGNIQITKVDQYNNKIYGAIFELRNSNNQRLAEGVSDSNGIVNFNELNAGNYIVVETYVPSNYILNSSPINLTVTGGNTTYRTVTNQYYVPNKPTEVYGNFKIRKIDDVGNSISGVKFELYNSNRSRIAVMVTDSNGVAIASELPKGTYYYKEVQVPTGYEINNNEYSFTVTGSGMVERTVVNNRINGSLKIKKVDDAGNPISGVKFEIYNSSRNIISTITTDSNGIATVSNLSNGTYYYKEVQVPAGVQIDNTEYSFNINGSTVVEKTIVNKLIKGSLKIIKVDELGNSLAQVKFNILDSNKNKIATIVTDNNGIATISDLSNGTYYYQEVNAPESVILDTNQYQFTIDNTNKYIEKKVVNNLIKGKIKVIKVDDLGNKIAGVKFEILDLKMNILDTIITDENGVATSKDLQKGKYYYREVEAPDNVIIDKQVYAFSITKNEELVQKTIINELIKGSLQIIKKDDYSNPIQGVKFDILNSNKKVVDTITTDKNGIAQTSNLPLGKYYYKEVKVPDNVIIDSKEYEFNIQNGITEKNIVNVLKKSKLQIIKLDKLNKEPIANVKFQILNENKEVVDTVVTDSQGNAYSKDLVLGKYYYKEIEAPEKYKIDTKEYEFKIKGNNEDIQKIIYNVPKESLPATGSSFGSNIGLILMISGVTIGGYVIVLSIRKKEDISKINK